MPSEKSTVPQAYVQWNQLRQKDVNNTKPFQRRRTTSLSCTDIQRHTNKTISSLSVNSYDLCLGSNGDYYFEWDQYQRLFDPLDKVLITRAPPPEIKPAWQKKEGETDPETMHLDGQLSSWKMIRFSWTHHL